MFTVQTDSTSTFMSQILFFFSLSSRLLYPVTFMLLSFLPRRLTGNLTGTTGTHTFFPDYSPLKNERLSVGCGESNVACVGQSFRVLDKTWWESHDKTEG